MLRLENVKKSFAEPGGGRLPVLEIANYRVAAAEQAVLIGSSGCGKTTLLHVIAGVSRPDSGLVEVDGQDLGRLSEAAMDRFRAQKIGYVFQTFNLLPAFTALENVLLGMSFVGRGPDRAWAEQVLSRVGLKDRLRHRPHQLSMGQQQRVCVARALANRPKLLLADEPTANVDSRNQQQIIDLIRQTCEEEKISLVLVTHVPDVARQFARVDRLEDLNRALQPA